MKARRSKHLGGQRRFDAKLLARGRVCRGMRFRVDAGGRVLTASGIAAPQVQALAERRRLVAGREPGALFAAGWTSRQGAIYVAASLGPTRGPGWKQRPLPSDDPANDLEQRLRKMLEESEFRSAIAALNARAQVLSPSARRTRNAKRRSAVTASASAIREQMRSLARDLARIEDAQR